ncbi:D-glycerate dehydrogenase, partial [Acidobacteria bacterium ACD]|nr:D-glycerate dehydrogenase [Acidobacteria bacterium ACD]
MPGLALLRQHCETVEVNPEDRVLSRPELLTAVAGRDGVLCLLTDTIDEEVLTAAGPQCRVFANMAVGFNNVDLAAATRRGVLITNTPGVLTETTADLTWALLMAVARRIVESDRHFRTGHWQGWGPMQFLGRDIHGATLGIIGAGRIGTAVGLRSAGFQMRILYTSEEANGVLDKLGARRVALENLLR